MFRISNMLNGWSKVAVHSVVAPFTDTTTYRRIDNFNLTTTIINSNKLLRKLQLRFDKLLSTPTNKQLLDIVTKDKLQLPYMKLLPN